MHSNVFQWNIFQYLRKHLDCISFTKKENVGYTMEGERLERVERRVESARERERERIYQEYQHRLYPRVIFHSTPYCVTALRPQRLSQERYRPHRDTLAHMIHICRMRLEINTYGIQKMYIGDRRILPSYFDTIRSGCIAYLLGS